VYALLSLSVARPSAHLPSLRSGKRRIRRERYTLLLLYSILNLLAHDASVDEILQEYKGLTKEDILACLLYASETLEDTTFMPLHRFCHLA
jgi:uncharacterized protein (DUF433 family)